MDAIVMRDHLGDANKKVTRRLKMADYPPYKQPCAPGWDDTEGCTTSNSTADTEREESRFLTEAESRLLTDALNKCAPTVAPEPCVWREDWDGVWFTHCGNSFQFDCGTPAENGAKYCLYCGKPLEQRLHDIFADA